MELTLILSSGVPIPIEQYEQNAPDLSVHGSPGIFTSLGSSRIAASVGQSGYSGNGLPCCGFGDSGGCHQWDDGAVGSPAMAVLLGGTLNSCGSSAVVTVE